MQAIMYLIDHGLLDYEPTPLPPSFAFPRINDDPGQSFVSEHLGDRIVLSAFEIDDQLLKDIGVSSAGHRLRIRNAIAKLEAKETADGSLTSAPPRIAERQQSVSTLPPARYQSQAWSNQKANAGT